MTNVLDFNNVLTKKNRNSRKDYRKTKVEKKRIWTTHFEYRRSLRKISVHLVHACLKKGRMEVQNGAIHYVMNNLHVVVDIHNEVLLTTYLKTDYSVEVQMELDAA